MLGVRIARRPYSPNRIEGHLLSQPRSGWEDYRLYVAGGPRTKKIGDNERQSSPPKGYPQAVETKLFLKLPPEPRDAVHHRARSTSRVRPKYPAAWLARLCQFGRQLILSRTGGRTKSPCSRKPRAVVMGAEGTTKNAAGPAKCTGSAAFLKLGGAETFAGSWHQGVRRQHGETPGAEVIPTNRPPWCFMEGGQKFDD